MKFSYFYLAGLACAGAVAAVLLWRSRRSGAILTACAPLALYQAAATVTFMALGGAKDDSWTSSTLAVPVAMAHGLNGYATLDSGSVQTLMYPPVWAAVYSIAGIFSDPAAVIALAFVIAAFFCLAPLWWFSRTIGGDGRLGACLAGLLAWAAWNSEPLWHITYRVRPDAPALGFALLACGAAVASKSGRRWGLPAAVVFAWLSVWTKQVMAPLLVVVPLWIAWTHVAGVRKRLATWWVGAGATVVLPWLIWIPFEALWLNLVTIPARCPWGGEWPLNVVRTAGELFAGSWFPLAILAMGMAADSRLWNSRRPAQEFLAGPAGLTLLVALVHVPISLLGRIKTGGDPNTLCPTIYFLWAAAAAVMVALCGSTPKAGAEPNAAAARTRAALGVIVLLSIPPWGAQLMRSAQQRGSQLGRNIDSQAYNFLRETGRNVYFPFRPVAHLQATGSFYHTARAVYDREVQAGFMLSPSQVEGHFPAAPEAVCWESHWGAEYVREKYFPKHRTRVALDGLDDFACFSVRAGVEVSDARRTERSANGP